MNFLASFISIIFLPPSVVAPDISVVGYDGDWYVGRENVQMTCKANANPPAHHFRWIRWVYSVCDLSISLICFFFIDPTGQNTDLENQISEVKMQFLQSIEGSLED